MQIQKKKLDIVKNIFDSITLIQTAEGSVIEVKAMIMQIKELMVQAVNETKAMRSGKIIQMEFDQLIEEIGSLAERVQFDSTPSKYSFAPDTIFTSDGGMINR